MPSIAPQVQYITQILKYDKKDRVGLHVIIETPYMNMARFFIPEVLTQAKANLVVSHTTRPRAPPEEDKWWGIVLKPGNGEVPEGGWTPDAIIEEFKRAIRTRRYFLDDYTEGKPGDFPPGFDCCKAWLVQRNYKPGEI